MDPWIDTHFVKVQDLPKGITNTVAFGGKTFAESGFLSYSAAATAQVCLSAVYLSRFLISCRPTESPLSTWFRRVRLCTRITDEKTT